MTMIKVGFELEIDEGALIPTAGDIVVALTDGLPKEWWADHREGSWGVKALYPLNVDGTLQQSDVRFRPFDQGKEIRKLEALLNQEKKLTTHLETRLHDEVTAVAEQLAEVTEGYEQSLKDWVIMRGLRDSWQRQAKTRLATINSNVDIIAGLQADVYELKNQRKGADKSLTLKQNDINRLRQSLVDANREAQNHAMMVAKIVGAMTAAGYDVAGWGDDDQLANLEGSLDDIKSAAAELGDTLNEVRTER